MTAQSSISAANSGIRPTGLLNGASTFSTVVSDAGFGGPLYGSGVSGGTPGGLAIVFSGACVASTLRTVLTFSGRGVISCLLLAAQNATVRTQRMKVTLDGIIIFDATAALLQNATAYRTACVIGSVMPVVTINSGSAPIYEPLLFNTSLLVEYSSDLTETNQAIIAYRYIPR